MICQNKTFKYKFLYLLLVDVLVLFIDEKKSNLVLSEATWVCLGLSSCVLPASSSLKMFGLCTRRKGDNRHLLQTVTASSKKDTLPCRQVIPVYETWPCCNISLGKKGCILSLNGPTGKTDNDFSSYEQTDTIPHTFLVQFSVILFGGLTVACEGSGFLEDIQGRGFL